MILPNHKFLSAVALVLVLLVGATAAHASRITTDAGGLFPVPSHLTNAGTDRMTFSVPGAGTVTCGTTAADLSLTANTSAVGTLIKNTLGLTLSGCADTNPTIDLVSCVSLVGDTASYVYLGVGTPGTAVVALVSYVRCGISGDTRACYYQLGAGYSLATTVSALNFSSVTVTRGVPSGVTVFDDRGAACGSTTQTTNAGVLNFTALTLNAAPVSLTLDT